MNSEETKICAICLGSVVPGQGQAIFTAECSHSFHFGCIGNSVTHGNRVCPLCRERWDILPFVMLGSDPNFNASPRTPPVRSRVFEPEPLLFCDDEPLSDGLMTDNLPVGSVNVAIRTIPERPAIAASECVPCFSVLVGLKAPSISDDARNVQRAPIDLVTVLDVSGSMHGSKLALLKRAVNFVIDNLGPSDRLSVISFSTTARRVFPLRRMVEHGRHDAKRAVNALSVDGLTNIVEGLTKGVRVLEERQHKNPVASIIFLSDGQDTCRHIFPNESPPDPSNGPRYLKLLPASICPSNRDPTEQSEQEIFPVHAFGFGSDHDAVAMHAISDSSSGTFSFIESYEMVQDAFASCIGGLLSVVTQDLRLMARSASHGVEIISIPSGRYASEIKNQGSEGTINVGDLYADEEKEFLINLSIPVLANTEGEENEGKTSLLDIKCTYRDAISQERVQIESGDLVEIQRPEVPTSPDNAVSIEVDRQRNRLAAAETITEATRMADSGNLTGAQTLLSDRRSNILASPAGQSQDSLSMNLEAEMKEIQERMGNLRVYHSSGRAYALSNISSHSSQRATTRGDRRRAASDVLAYETPLMASMLRKSQQLDKEDPF